MPSTDGCQTDISVFHPDGNFNQYELVCFGIGYIQNHSTLLSNEDDHLIFGEDFV